MTTLGELITSGARQLEQAGVSFGHGTTNARDEAAWLATRTAMMGRLQAAVGELAATLAQSSR